MRKRTILIKEKRTPNWTENTPKSWFSKQHQGVGGLSPGEMKNFAGGVYKVVGI